MRASFCWATFCAPPSVHAGGGLGQEEAVDLAADASKAVRAAKLLSSSAAELAKSVELAACARGVEAYLAGGGSDNLAHDLALHVWPRAGPGTL